MDNVTLNIKKEFLEEILSGIKKVEYRSSSLSLLNKIKKLESTPFELRLINGMKKNAPEATVLVTKLLYDDLNASFEFHIGSVVRTVNCETLSTNLSNDDYLEITLPAIELPKDKFNALKSGETDSFFLKDSKENHEYVESAKLLLPVWIEATCGKDRIELVLIQILDDFFEPSFEMRILKKPR